MAVYREFEYIVWALGLWAQAQDCGVMTGGLGTGLWEWDPEPRPWTMGPRAGTRPRTMGQES